ncbi:hypothetical protein BDV37DRAFT_235759 [Aspergillus pseudonomiae]|uniref:Uncharacterized protein n=1 Tax=Aspergillus pseudonomiae TaxID=1506151 RepID=A0A5N7DV82_9EURO|nr:uncharacterized protein BDV37DRAFT_235759 [Aspergillus pseudonomiae]KAE8409418.1 hypothetical protein BDV37DRAFT_235759 [Aspergillus pseudonomiae]
MRPASLSTDLVSFLYIHSVAHSGLSYTQAASLLYSYVQHCRTNLPEIPNKKHSPIDTDSSKRWECKQCRV